MICVYHWKKTSNGEITPADNLQGFEFNSKVCTKKEHPDWDTPMKNGRRLTFPQTSAVSSARAGLTSLFGMGRGEHRLCNHPNNGFDIGNKTYKGKRLRKVFGLLVPLGFDIAAFTPAAYQGRSLRPPCNEVSSWGRLAHFIRLISAVFAATART